jgi:interferon-induced GTP-binding protein Mx1
MLTAELNTTDFHGLLSAIDKIREVLHENKTITLSEIAVVGEQSVGKSSVLEAISGIQLPRAQDMCTRCPLELRMKVSTDKEYATIRGREDEEEIVINDLLKVSELVQDFMQKIAGEGKNVSSNPIILTVYKRAIPYDLILIDLPGITRYASRG